MDPGSFFIDGEEIEIDFDQDIPPHLLTKLERSPMNQLDAFSLRKRIHQLSGFISNAVGQSEMRITEMEKTLLQIKREELFCKADYIPKLMDERIHKIVNGKFDSINETLTIIKSDQKNIVSSLEIFNKELMEKISYVANKTLFGGIKNAYIKHPLRTILGFGLLSITSFVYVMATLRINSFSEAWQALLKWFS